MVRCCGMVHLKCLSCGWGRPEWNDGVLHDPGNCPRCGPGIARYYVRSDSQNFRDQPYCRGWSCPWPRPALRTWTLKFWLWPILNPSRTNAQG